MSTKEWELDGCLYAPDNWQAGQGGTHLAILLKIP